MLYDLTGTLIVSFSLEDVAVLNATDESILVMELPDGHKEELTHEEGFFVITLDGYEIDDVKQAQVTVK